MLSILPLREAIEPLAEKLPFARRHRIGGFRKHRATNPRLGIGATKAPS